jgi:hypothetical protein
MIKLQRKALRQPTQDNSDHMVNKLESGTTVSRSFSQGKYKSPHHKRQEKMKKDLKHTKCFKCSDMGHYAFMCSAQVESKTRLSRRQRRHLRTIICFRCKKEDHKIQAYPNSQVEPHCSGKIGQTGLAAVCLPSKDEDELQRVYCIKNKTRSSGSKSETRKEAHVQDKRKDMLLL